ncbi:MAG: hypothetical protein GXY83_22960 [Rhodopirellula sp.]|nr:hypothetical protein [Rhodopirellula sp.]
MTPSLFDSREEIIDPEQQIHRPLLERMPVHPKRLLRVVVFVAHRLG